MKPKRSLPPYLRIVADIRAKVRAGTLRPGARLPSTRELAKQEGVALATAAHALRTLVQQGEAQAIARVGTVVARGAALGPSGAELSLDRVVRMGLHAADEEGLDALSVRGLAAKLGVSPMALYRYFKDKDDLLDRMVVAALHEESFPSAVPRGWRAQLEVAARTEWRVLRRHPWLARVVNLPRPRPIPVALNLTEWVLRALEETRLDATTRMNVHIMLHAYIQGMGVNLEEQARAMGETGLTDEEWMHTQKDDFTALAEGFPAFARFMFAVRSGFDLDFDALFEFGLRALLDGVEAMVRRAGGRRRGS
jgi:AcrR family transcriptional regulator